MAAVSADDMARTVNQVLNRWPTAGMAVAVVRDGSPAWFHRHGVADATSGTPVTEDTVFPIDSVTKTMTAIAVMQLWERGLVDLDAPAEEYLRAFPLVRAKPGFRKPTLRHLLTHTAGVRAVRTAADLLRPTLAWGVPAGRPVPSPAEYYGRGLRVDFDPGSRWAYSNHGFTALGQVVEDVSGTPYDRYLRERVFEPLRMEHTDLHRSARVRPGLATGYVVRRRGLVPVTDYEVVTAGGGAVYSTAGDMARYVEALLGGGTNRHGTVLKPETLATMFEAHHRSDPRVPGMGLGFFREDVGGHRVVAHDGIWTGFHASMVLAPDDGVGAVALANTGAFNPVAMTTPTVDALLRLLLDVDDSQVAGDAPERPWTWDGLCGWYSLGPGVLADPQPRMLGPGAEVVVRRGHLMLRGLVPVPAVRRGVRLHPDGDDGDVFFIDLSGIGAGATKVVFSRRADGTVAALHFALQPVSLQKRPHAPNPRVWVDRAALVTGAAGAAGAAAVAVRRRRHR
ncbi:MAG TPA: serine hydrolase domain-containing protein [Nocardioidaceae bacterium]|nr:serine hydrolase domain-containing protein [Nocardioidaceae bacterium]